MKRLIWIAIAFVAAGVAVLWAFQAIEGQRLQPSALMPDGALLYLEAKDFRGLLKDWNGSEEKRTWLKGDDYAAFSRSRLFQRLSQAQDEFSAAATLTTDESLLSSVAGKQSALALYDIGNLEFVYVTRMDQSAAEATPLWQTRSKFESRTEGSAQFFVRRDTQSNRTAAFAARDGWLVLGTRDDLVAGVLDRIQGVHAHSLPDEDWFADAVKDAKGPADDLRMVLNLEKIVPSPYFRSYWVQRNITEMKQYRAALCDLHRTAQLYRENRFLLRKPNNDARSSGDVQALAALAPGDSVWYGAQASPSNDDVLIAMRQNLLDMKPEQARATWTAPVAVQADNAGSASMLEERIDVAPVIAQRSDPYQAMRDLLDGAQPAAVMEAYSTSTAPNEMFVGVERAVVIEAKQNWDEAVVQNAIISALRPGLTASQLGLQWKKTGSTSGEYEALEGRIPLFAVVRAKRLFLTTDAAMMEKLLARVQSAAEPATDGVTYASVFRHTAREQRMFRKLVNRLDSAGHTTATGAQTDGGDASGEGQSSPFFSGNIDSLSRMFHGVTMESIQEKDQGAQVVQTVIYQWQQHQ